MKNNNKEGEGEKMKELELTIRGKEDKKFIQLTEKEYKKLLNQETILTYLSNKYNCKVLNVSHKSFYDN
ncbi:MAG: hypothetical protein ACOC1O_02780 [bacterium]